MFINMLFQTDFPNIKVALKLDIFESIHIHINNCNIQDVRKNS